MVTHGIRNRWQRKKRGSRNSSQSIHRRLGAATVELAIGITPVILVFLGTLDLCQIFFIRENVTTITFEMARIRARPGATDEGVRQRGLALCQQQGIADPIITVSTESTDFGYNLCKVDLTIPKNQPTLFGIVPQTGFITVRRSTLSEDFQYPED